MGMSGESGMNAGRLAEKLQETLDENELVQCMRCGFCLPACPTYRITGQEAASPRGRIALMKAAADGLMQPDEGFRQQLELCLGCRACEPACPAGVSYGALLEQARAAIHEEAPRNGLVRIIERFFFRQLFPYPWRLRIAGAFLSLWQRSGLQYLFHQSGLARLLPDHVRELDEILPKAAIRGVRSLTGPIVRPIGTPIGRVGLLSGCVMDVLFPKTHANTIRLLAAAGYEVIIPDGQACCGALQAHAGDRKTAKALAKRNIRAFRDAGVDWIVSNAGGCGTMMAEYGHLLADEPDWRENAEWFGSKVKDISSLLTDGRTLSFRAKRPVRLTYQDSCHLRNGMGVADEPRRLLRSIRDAEYVELFEAGRCCGSAGIYNLLEPDMSKQILDEKMNHVRATGAGLVVTANPGCLLQMKWGIKRAGLNQQAVAVHLADVLAECLETTEESGTE
jgi:glycolate oxidase iron-sulfur subunit